MTDKMAPQYGYAVEGRKVHVGFAAFAMRCTQGPEIVNIIAVGGNSDTRREMFATLMAAKVPPSKLCGHCFPIAVRKAYANAIAATKVA